MMKGGDHMITLLKVLAIYWIIGMIVAILAINVFKVFELEDMIQQFNNNAGFLAIATMWPCLIIGVIIGIIRYK